MKRIQKFLSTALVLATLTAAPAFGATVLYDGFEIDGAPYGTVGTNASVFNFIDATAPTGKNGGTGFAGGWLRFGTGANSNSFLRVRTESPGLTYTDASGNVLKTKIGQMHWYTRVQVGTEPIQNLTYARQMWAAGSAPAAGSTVYFAFVAGLLGSPQLKISFNGGTNSDLPGVFFGNDAGNANGNITVNLQDTANAVFSVNLGIPWVGATNLLVGRISNYAQTTAQLDVWLNPTNIANIGGQSPTTTIISSNGLAMRTFDSFRNSGGANYQGYLDELRVSYGTGAAFTDVAPIFIPPYQVRVETKADGSGTVVGAQTLTAGGSITNFAIARDEANNFIENTPAPWAMVNVTGGVTNSDLTVAPGNKSAVFTAHLAGTGEIQAAAAATNLVNSGTITVASGGASQIRVETAADSSGTVVPAQNIPSGSSITVYSNVRDIGGNFLSNSPAVWSLINKSNGVVNADLVVAGDNMSATFTANLAGSAVVQATSGTLTTNVSGVLTATLGIVWRGDGAGNLWDTTSLLWWLGSAGGSTTNFVNADDVTFEDNGSNNVPVSLVGSLSPRAVTVSGGLSYTFAGTGKITGAASLTHNSPGTLLVLTTNDYSGSTVVSQGVLQLGNGTNNGSFGTGIVSINTGGASLIFNRTDPAGSPYVVSNQITGVAEFLVEFKTGTVRLAAASGNNNRANAVVRNGARLILAKASGNDLGQLTAAETTTLTIDAGGYVQLGGTNTSTDHINSGGKKTQIDGTLDVNGQLETLGPILGAATGLIDNTSTNAAILTVNNGVAAYGQNNEDFTFYGRITNSGAGALAITKDSTNRLFLSQANFHRGDTRIINGGVLQIDNSAGLTNSTLDLQAADSGRLSFGTLTSAVLGGLKGAHPFVITNESGAAMALTLGANGQSTTFASAMNDGGAGSTVTKIGAGALTLSGTNTYTGATTINGGALFVNGGIAGSVTAAAGTTLGGSGIIAGATALSTGSTLQPGSTNNTIGVLTVNNSVTMTATTTNRMELNRTNAVTSDKLAASSVTLNGVLIVTNLGPTLHSGDSFTLFSGTLSGSFASTTLPSLFTGLSWNTSALATSGIISVTGTATPPPITSTSLSGTNFVLKGTGGLSGATYYLLASTNVAQSLADWPRLSTNVFAANGNFTNTIPMTAAPPQRYFLLQVP